MTGLMLGAHIDRVGTLRVFTEGSIQGALSSFLYSSIIPALRALIAPSKHRSEGGALAGL